MASATFAEPVYAADVSYWQSRKRINYPKAYEDGCVLVVVKRSQLEASKKGREHARLVDASPCSRGDYHYADTKPLIDQLHPERQAEIFCKEVGELRPGDSIPWCDAEWMSFNGDVETREEYYRTFNRQANHEWVLSWCYEVEKRLGVAPGIYTLASYARYRLVLSDPELTSRPLWLANAGRSSTPKLTHKVPTVRRIEAGWDPDDLPGDWLKGWSLYQWWTKKGTSWYKDGEGAIDLDLPRHGMMTIGELLVLKWLQKWGWIVLAAGLVVFFLMFRSAASELSEERAARAIVADQLAAEVEMSQALRKVGKDLEVELAKIHLERDQVEAERMEALGALHALERAGLVDYLNSIPHDQWPWVP
jgi:GH25 family lysozyme M1 (1,4-beta-N-acetylmuramidase)